MAYVYLTYAQVNEKLGKRDSRKVANNTYYQRRENGDIAMRLHETDIVTFHGDNTATFNSGGWRTVTTKERMSGVVNVSQRDRVWTIAGVQFFDGITIDLNTGEPVNARDLSAENAEDAALRKAIDKYLDGFNRAWAVGLLGADVDYHNFPERFSDATHGDCFYCLLRTTDTHKPMGDAFNDHEHLMSHMEDGYRPLSLVFNAYAARQYGNVGVVLEMQLVRLAQGEKAYDLRRNLREYMMQRLAPHLASLIGPAQSTGFAVR